MRHRHVRRLTCAGRRRIDILVGVALGPRLSQSLAALGLAVVASGGSAANCGAARAEATPRLHRRMITVSPAPGTQFNEPGTQISFRGVSPRSLRGLTVTGSLSGPHAGRIEADSDGHGASFLPAAPFLAGETVSVRMRLPVVGAPSGSFSFTIGTPGLMVDARMRTDVPPPLAGVQVFHTRRDLSPTAITVTADREPRRDGDIFVAPQSAAVQSGPMILDPAGRLVWFDPLPVMAGLNAMNFRVQTLNGQPVLTWWQGTELFGNGLGEGVILNRHYQPVATVRAGNGLAMDLHEFLLTPQGDAYIVATSPLTLPHWGLPVLDNVIQEIDIRTGLVLFEWNALENLPLSDSYVAPGATGPFFDPYHINSIVLAPDGSGNLIVSMRDTSAVYEIDRRTGAVLWRLGGKRSSFRFGWGAGFAYQHFATTQSGNRLSLFDDNGGPSNTHRPSRGLTLQLNFHTMTVRLAQVFDHNPPLRAYNEGSVQMLGDGEAFLGWGGAPYISEDDASGRPDFDARFDYRSATYRAYRFVWAGQPQSAPSVVVGPGPSGQANVYASWNGATDVARWVVLGSSASGGLRPIASHAPTGFETRLPISARIGRVAVEALDAHGTRLAISRVVSVSRSLGASPPIPASPAAPPRSR